MLEQRARTICSTARDRRRLVSTRRARVISMASDASRSPVPSGAPDGADAPAAAMRAHSGEQQQQQQQRRQQHQQQRRPPYILGLTGSIGMGKSTVSSMFAERGVPVIDADAIVHALYSKGGAAVGPVAAAFPSAVVDGAVSRPALSGCVVGDEAAMRRLEGLVHPLVEAERLARMRGAAAGGAALIVLDIPLLYETKGEAACDGVAVVSAPPGAQRARVLARPGMSEAKLDAILARQVPDEDKRRRADFVIDTGCSVNATAAAVDALIAKLLSQGAAGGGGGVGGAYERALAAAEGGAH
ncbi:MAG: dephospho-CoA kinase-domain-containing protein [Monoraphidium minutum]|nr:MAG: dephospho-CoA kinase-domain-containing protein [Monoraphidium minutum]